MDCAAFNTKVGFITNLASNFIAMLNNYNENSEEYKEIRKRIDILRKFQGDCIDAAKGEIFIPPPKEWSKKQKYISITSEMTPKEKKEAEKDNQIINFNNKICGDRKPYFFGYVYPKYLRDHMRHKKNYKKMCELLFGCTIYELSQKKDKTSKEITFLKRYYKYMPLLVNNCTMNILCKYVEDVEFDNKWKKSEKQFDYTILMSDNYDIDDKELYLKIKNIIKEFNKKYNLVIKEKRELIELENIVLDEEEEDGFNLELSMLIQDYENILISLCSDAHKVTDYLINIYYKHYKNNPKTLLWGQFGEYILENVKFKTEKAYFPILDENGQDYLGRKYSLKEVDL